MRAIALAILACILLTGCGIYGFPAATAGPGALTTTTPREQPPDDARVMFTDNPSIVESHPVPFDSWSRIGNDALALHFTTGSPECFGVHATVHETAESVAVELRSGTLPEAVGRACIMIAVFGTLTVPLPDPLGDRTVLSVY